jgi:hypothetical protein
MVESGHRVFRISFGESVYAGFIASMPYTKANAGEPLFHTGDNTWYQETPGSQEFSRF